MGWEKLKEDASGGKHRTNRTRCGSAQHRCWMCEPCPDAQASAGLGSLFPFRGGEQQPEGGPKAGPWDCVTQPQLLQGQREGETEPAQEGW